QDEKEKKLNDMLPCTENLELKVGATVVLIVNLNQEEGLCNGLQGIVTSFSKIGIPRVKFINGIEKDILLYTWQIPVKKASGKVKGKKIFCGLEVKQIPLILGFALTVHKAQGMTLHNNKHTNQQLVTNNLLKDYDPLSDDGSDSDNESKFR